MDPALEILFCGLALMICGGGGMFLLLVAAERLWNWLTEQARLEERDDD